MEITMPKNVHPIPFIIQPPADLVAQKPELRRWSAGLSQKFVDKQVVTDAELKAIGGALWDALGAGEKFEAAHKAAGNAILPLIIESGAADVQALPWEILHHPEIGFLGKHPVFTLTRRTQPPAGDMPALEKGPLRVLLFTSLPDDVNPEKGRLDVEEEQAQVQDALLPWIAKGLVALEMPDDGRFETFKVWLRDFDPHVVFLSGHGRFFGEAHLEEKIGVFLFEDETGDSLPVREEALAEAFVGSNVRTVVLSACESGKSASDLLNNGLTRRLSRQGIPHVIGMRESVYDRAGILFARALCDELARAERVDAALQAARIAIQMPFEGSDVTRREAGTTAGEELSYGQWSLPTVFSPRPEAALIAWDFAPQAVEIEKRMRLLSNVSLPPRFLGRRAELRQQKSGLLKGTTRKLLVTGPGGQGKTSLAGKLAQDLQKAGWSVFAWSIRPENRWKDFEFEMELALDEPNAKKFDHYRPRFESDAQRAGFLLDLLAEQFGGRFVLFLDNLETVQDGESLAVTDPAVAAWLEAAGGHPALTLLVTSRWVPPGWTGAHLELGRVTYGDFLQIARQRLPAAFWQNRERMRRAYEALGGNPRGLEFLAAAVADMQPNEEEAFFAALEQTKAEVQANMALDAIYARLPNEAKSLLRRLPAYHEPVPAEGILKLGMDIAGAGEVGGFKPALLERLLAVSLLEVSYQPDWGATEYALPPLVSDWLEAKKLTDDSLEWKSAAADYHLYLRRHERRTLPQAVTTHHALRRADRNEEADRLTLDFIVGPLTMAGFYTALLTDWLPRVWDSQDMKTRAEALGQTGKILHHLGDFEHALPFMKQSLTIMQQIGDKAGEGTTLFNMGHIYMQNEQVQEAVGAWVTVYVIAKQINEYQALQALSKLAPQLGLPEGLEGWEMLAERMKDEGGGMNEEKSELEQIEAFVTGLARAHREKSPDAGKYFESVSKMAVDPNAPPYVQELGNVLKQYMSGVKTPDLSKLPKEIAVIVGKAIREG
jgi:tetratricopeptide (TPR) repeat protein